MSKISDPWKCDECSTPKKPSNGWFIAFVVGDVLTIQKWDDILAGKDNMSHLCGIDCSSRWLVKELAKIYQNNQVQSNG